jgi:predicted O-methyltransferase YrrM
MVSAPIHLRNIPPPHEVFDHIGFIVMLAKVIRPDIYLELGVRDGRTISAVRAYAKRSFGVDTTEEEHVAKMPIEFFKMTTDEFASKLPSLGVQFDMVLIDANHSHEASLKDFDNIFPYVVEDGLIFLHDTYPYNEEYTKSYYCADSWKTARYIRKNYSSKCEIMTIPVQPGLSVVRKSTRQLAWNPESIIDGR